MKKWIIAVVGAGMLAGCATAPPPRVAVAAPAKPAASELPYLWTTGAAPQAYKDLVAGFGRNGLKPGEYLWASDIPTGETRIVIDRLIQTAYVYRGDKL